uniref:Colorectal cancer associated 2 n=1 Tax=Ornithorhynchus anatinus TaxID=9258 RepID=F6UKC7_ORNAN
MKETGSLLPVAPSFKYLQSNHRSVSIILKEVSRGGSARFPAAGSSPQPAPYLEGEAISPTPGLFQPPPLFPGRLSCDDSPGLPICLDQLFEPCLPPEPLADASLNSVPAASHCLPDNRQPPLFCCAPSLVPSSPGSSVLSSPLDYGYSPPQQPAFAPGAYNPSPPLDSRDCGLPPEDFPYPHFHGLPQYDCRSPTAGYCPSCGADPADALRVCEYFSYPSPDGPDWPTPITAADAFWTREVDWDACCS